MFLKAEPLNLPYLRHGFFGREGGVSKGDHASLNGGLMNGDNLDDALENRRRAMNELGIQSPLNTLYQAHTADVIYLTEPLSLDARPRGDAMVTDKPNLPLGILSADCVPILFADTTKPIIGAAHSGWRGTVANIGQATITAMEKLGSDRKNIIAILGPCIAKESYEFGAEAADLFPEPFRTPLDSGKYLVDLPTFITSTLGIRCENLQQDTFTNPAFFSSRRAKGAKFGLNISAISLVSNP